MPVQALPQGGGAPEEAARSGRINQAASGSLADPASIFAGIICLASLACMAVLTLLTAPSDAEAVNRVIWTRSVVRIPRALIADGYPVHRRVRLWRAITVGVFAVLYVAYW